VRTAALAWPNLLGVINRQATLRGTHRFVQLALAASGKWRKHGINSENMIV
jgi:hypothetical protein